MYPSDVTKSETRQLTAVVTVRCTEEERGRWESAAAAADLTSRSAWCRAAILAFERGGGGLDQPEHEPALPSDPAFRTALDRVKAAVGQIEDSPAIRAAVVKLAELLADPKRATLVFAAPAGASGGRPKARR